MVSEEESCLLSLAMFFFFFFFMSFSVLREENHVRKESVGMCVGGEDVET